jgi:hypothetical protein
MTFNPVKKRSVTVQSLSMTKGVPYYLGFLSEVYLGEGIPSKDGKPAKQPPHLARVVNLETGEEVQVILPTVVVSELSKAYPEGIATLCFELTVIPPREGKNYNLANITEIEAPAEFTAVVSAASAKAPTAQTTSKKAGK